MGMSADNLFPLLSNSFNIFIESLLFIYYTLRIY